MINYNKQHIDKKDITSAVNVLKSDFLTQGKQIAKFENKLKLLIVNMFAQYRAEQLLFT